MTLKKVRFLSKTGRFLSCYEIVKLKNSVFCIKKRYKVLKKARCTVDWRSIRDLNSGGATNALSHFECDPFDLLGNAPYSNPPKSSPEKGEKSRREQQIFNCRKQWIFDDGSLENQRQLPKCLLDFECSLLRPLEYICIFNFVARNFPQGVISSATPSTSWVMLHSINFVQLIITACGANVNSLQVGKCQWGVSAMNVCVFCMTSCRVARSCKTSPVSRE